MRRRHLRQAKALGVQAAELNADQLTVGGADRCAQPRREPSGAD
jgi:hypothetical protein